MSDQEVMTFEEFCCIRRSEYTTEEILREAYSYYLASLKENPKES